MPGLPSGLTASMFCMVRHQPRFASFTGSFHCSPFGKIQSWPLPLDELSSHFSTEQVLIQVLLPTIRQLYLHCIPVLPTAGKNPSYPDVCSSTSSNNSAPRVI